MILDFLKQKKAERLYKNICSKMHNVNSDLLENGDSFIVKSKIGKLEYSFNDQNQEITLKYDGDVIYHKEDIYTDSEVHICNLERADFASSYLKEELKNPLPTRKEALSDYKKMVNKLSTINTGNFENGTDDNLLFIRNKINGIDFNLEYSLAGDDKDQMTTIKMGNEILFKEHSNSFGEKVFVLKASKIQDMIKNYDQKNDQKNDENTQKNRTKMKRS